MTRHQHHTINQLSLQILAYKLKLKTVYGVERKVLEGVILDLEKLRATLNKMQE